MDWIYTQCMEDSELSHSWEAVVECSCPYLIYRTKFTIFKEDSGDTYYVEVMSELASDSQQQEEYECFTLEEAKQFADNVNAKHLHQLQAMLKRWLITA